MIVAIGDDDVTAGIYANTMGTEDFSGEGIDWNEFVTHLRKAMKTCIRRRSYFFAALFAAQRLFVAAMIAALPAALSLRFGFAGASA